MQRRYAPRAYGRSYVRGRGTYYLPRSQSSYRAPAYRRAAPARQRAVAPRLAGSGKYRVFDAKKLGAGIGGVAGGALGNLIAPGIGGGVGGQIGHYLGNALGQGFRTLTGFGDYNVQSNSLMHPDRVVPSFGDDSIRVKKREYIADIDSSTGFSNNFFPINPGLDTSFPWLSSIANNYEQYHFNGLVFQYVSTSSDAIASTTNLGLGQVCLATDYNAADAAYVNLPQMQGSKFANSGKPSENIMHAVECAPDQQAQKLYYVRSGDQPEGTDIRMYDLGSFQLATDKMPAVYTGMGQLWVSYDVTFCKSVQNNQLGFDLNTDKYLLTEPSAAAPFGTSRTLVEHSNLGSTVSNTQIVFPPTLSSGYYLVAWQAVGDSTAVSTPTFTGANCTSLTTWQAGTSASITNQGSTSTKLINVRIWRIDERDATITLSGGTLPANGTVGDLLITQINGELFTTAS